MKKPLILLTLILLISNFLVGCASAPTPIINEQDPWETWNRKVQTFNDNLDNYVMKPTAKGYRWITPVIIDQSITNFFSNINDVGVTLNDLMQGKLKQSSLDGARFLVNSTAGVGGLIDVASMIDLPKHNEDFEQTLGVWGVPTGPYMVLPFFGPSSPRGAAGLLGDVLLNPVSYIGLPAVSTGLFVVNTTDQRADNLGTEKIAQEASIFGRYEFFRDAYIAKRRNLVLDSEVIEDPEFDLDDFEEEEFVTELDKDSSISGENVDMFPDQGGGKGIQTFPIE